MTLLPLTGLRVVDAADERGELCGRLLADLGAEVVRVEPAGLGSESRRRSPPGFAFRNHNKLGVTGDVEPLLTGADVLIEAGRPGSLGVHGLLSRHPGLVITSITPFGQTGPYRDFESTDLVAAALGGMIHRFGPAEGPPVAPPGRFVGDAAAVTAAFATMLALWQRRRTGRGQQVDVSEIESAANLADWSLPNWSQSGARAARQGPGFVYPVYRCADGHVRMVSPLNPREWRALKAWLGDPPEIAGDEWDSIVHRIANAALLAKLIGEFCAVRSRSELSEEGMARGLAVSPILRPAEVLANHHLAARGAFVDVDVSPGLHGRVMDGVISIDGARAGFRLPAPEVGEHDGTVAWPARVLDGAGPAGPPLAGVRVLDFGIGAVGVECSRLLAEQGADVVKVESRVHPDFIRVMFGSDMCAPFASSSRSKRALGVNLATEAGRALVRRLVPTADVVVENSATGAMDRLGFGWETLRGLHPGIVMVSSQLMGSSGPWSEWRGYGPNARGVAGLTWLWCQPSEEDDPPGVTAVHPDHLTGRLLALSALALLWRREESPASAGGGGHAEVAQVEAAMLGLGDLLLEESVSPGSVRPVGNRGAVYRCGGEDEWCVVEPVTDQQRAALEAMLDGESLAEWAAALPAYEVMTTLQAVGVPAGAALDAPAMATDPHYEARGYCIPVEQPGVGPLLLEGPAFRGSELPPPDVRPAPFTGQHTRDICSELLGMSSDEIDALLASGVLEEPPPTDG